ncbi:hypothetical protein MMRN_58680 [Mycobacterium marinum]|nr:hypothetical protein MMRN_58680 [Mycobacterium marinum]
MAAGMRVGPAVERVKAAESADGAGGPRLVSGRYRRARRVRRRPVHTGTLTRPTRVGNAGLVRPDPVSQKLLAFVHGLLGRIRLPMPNTDQYPSIDWHSRRPAGLARHPREPLCCPVRGLVP